MKQVYLSPPILIEISSPIVVCIGHGLVLIQTILILGLGVLGRVLVPELGIASDPGPIFYFAVGLRAGSIGYG